MILRLKTFWSVPEFMPHRKKPLAYALNLLRKPAYYDYTKKELLNNTTPEEFKKTMQQHFPHINVDKVIQSLPTSALIDGLVLTDRQGTGVLQAAGTPETLSIEEDRELVYKEAYTKYRGAF